MTYTVGELARRTGLTTRTLHHYETLGLLPAARSASGYRLYDDRSLAQLHAVLAYRYLGLPLKAIAALLADDPPPLRELLRRQAALVEERIAQHERLLLALRRCTTALQDGAPTLDEELLAIITATRLCEESLSPEEHRHIADVRASLTEADVLQIQGETQAIMQALETLRVRGADPASDEALVLARRFTAIRARIVGGDPAFHEKIRHIAAQSPELLRSQGITPELADYARAARVALEQAEAAAQPAAPAKARAAKAPKRASRSAA